MSLLNVQNLSLSIFDAEILININLRIESGQIVAVVGESGSGKSMTSNAIMQLLPEGTKSDGSIWLNDYQDLLKITEAEMCEVRKTKIGMIFQEPMKALNPLESIGAQVIEAIKLTEPGLTRIQYKEKAEIVLHRVGLENSRFPLSTYPHKLSGGQRQRVVIAIAISQKPKLLIADEPTTALDVTTQAKIMSLLKDLILQDNMGMLLISHDLGVVTDVADHIIIMKSGEIVEEGPTAHFFNDIKHEYTKALFAAAMQKGADKFVADYDEAVLEVKNLKKSYS